jgi:hypothetical protein
MITKLLKVALVILLYLVAFDVIGVVALFILDILPLFGKSTAAFYAAWFVAGFFCGVLSFNAAGKMMARGVDGDWSNAPDASRNAWFIMATTVVVLGLVSIPCYLLMWKLGSDSDSFVPDSMPMTITFFVAIFLANILSKTVFLPASKPAEPKS